MQSSFTGRELAATLSLEEYHELRATIRQRGTARAIVILVTFVSWAVAAGTPMIAPDTWPRTLGGLIILVAGFEVVFALHVGAERVGRYLQVKYERFGADGPQWETAAGQFGSRLVAAGHPLAAGVFTLATVINAWPSVRALLAAGTTFTGLWLPVLASATLVAHAAFLVRVLAATRTARTQRPRDQAVFEKLAPVPPPPPPGSVL